MAAGMKTGGRTKGVPNKATAKLKAETAATSAKALSGLTDEEIGRLKSRDVLRLVMLHWVRELDFERAADVAGKLAPYEHAKLAPIMVEVDAEPEDVKAARLHDALMKMRGTVGAPE
jgi:hypothetical protein